MAKKKVTKSNKESASGKQERFAIEYVKTLNATQAAINAGYAERSAYSQGSRLLKNDKVLSRVRELQQELLDQLPVSVWWIMEQYIEVYNRCMQKTEVIEWDYTTKSYQPTGEWQFDAKGAQGALDSMGKYFGMFTNKVQHSGSIDGPGTDVLQSILGQIGSTGSNDLVQGSKVGSNSKTGSKDDT